jgi:hypothetical protein
MFGRRLVAALLLVPLCWDLSLAESTPASIAVSSVPAGFARFTPGRETFGKLKFRGGLVLSSNDSRFGGFSGLAFSSEGDSLLAVSDDGWWFKAGVRYEDGRLAAVNNAVLSPMLDRNGRRPGSKRRRDAEAVALDPPGNLGASVYVGFESRTRIEKFETQAKGLGARPVLVSSPAMLAKGPPNAQLEALGKFAGGDWKGWLIALSERHLDDAGNIRGWLFKGNESRPFAIARHEDYDITDLTILPGGDVVLLERSYSKNVLPGMALRRFALGKLKAGDVIEPELLFSGRQPFYMIDNMEGISVHRHGDELRLSIISDDNYNRGAQRTILLQFAFSP